MLHAGGMEFFEWRLWYNRRIELHIKKRMDFLCRAEIREAILVSQHRPFTMP
jgi:hypothetical protein